MDEIEYKLRKKNAVLTVNAISKLVDTIQSKGAPHSGKIEQLPELTFLKKKCEDPEPLINITACQGIVTLVETGVLNVIRTLSGFISSLPTVRNYSGIVQSIGTLLVIDLKTRISETNSYKCPFNMMVPQHPLISVLKQNTDIWFDVCNVMQYITSHPDEIVVENSLELLRPVFLYTLCDPSIQQQFPVACRHQMWKLLIESSFSLGKKDLLLEVLSWLQVDTETQIVCANHFYMDLVEIVLQKEDTALCAALTPFMAASIHRLILSGHNPRSSFSALSRLLAVSPEASSCVLMLLAKCINACPVIYLKDLVSFCITLIETKTCNAIASKMLVCALLQWLVYPSHLTGEALQLASNILNQVNSTSSWPSYTGKLCGNKIFNQLRNTDKLVAAATELCRLAELWQSNPTYVQEWLGRLNKVPGSISGHLLLFVSALFVHTFDQNEVKHESFKLLLKLVEINNDFTAAVITLILYRLAEEKEPFIQLEFLRGLTKMAVQKENVNLILHTLELLKSRNSMKAVLLDLYVRLWKVENRCYPYLQRLIMESPIDGKDWKFDLSRALAIKEICETRPDQHGPELVKLLSQILNQCGGTTGGLASSLALQGITSLCKADIVNIATTWRALAPKLSRDKRPVVIKSLCEFFGYALSMECTGQEYEKLVTEVVTRLWSYVSTQKDPEIISAAYKALSKADMEKLSLKTLPECYRQRLQLPPSYTKTPVDAARKPEDVLPYIPCECWIQLLQNTKSELLDSAGDTLAAWLSNELTLYQSSMYRMANTRGEPASYSYLHHRSICRGLTDHLRKLSESHLDPSKILVVKQCLRILGSDLPRPLPPLNWSFLNEYLQQPELIEFCLMVATKQAVASPSARKVMENFFSTFEPSAENESIVRKLFENLTSLCKGVPPNSLKPFIEKSFIFGMEKSSQNGEENELLLKELFSWTKATLKQDDIHDANRVMLSLLIEGMLEKFDANNKMFNTYVNCVTELTSKHLERMSSPSVWWEVTPDKLRQALGIRSALACKADTVVPLVWLNECIDATLELVGEHTSVLQSTAQVLSSIREHESNNRWTMELLGQIHNIVNKKTESDNQQAIVFVCDVFLLTVIILSGYDCLVPSLEYISSSRENRLQLFPQALDILLTKEQWKPSISQVMEWLYHMQNFSAVSSLYADTFHRGLMALRHYKYFKTLSVWTRIISCRYVKLQ